MRKSVLYIRVSKKLLQLIHAAAELEDVSVNTWCISKLEKIVGAGFTDEQLRDFVKRISLGDSVSKISNDFGMNRKYGTQMAKACHNRGWIRRNASGWVLTAAGDNLAQELLHG